MPNAKTILPAAKFKDRPHPGERTGLSQGGDGLDWHPILEEMVGAFRANIPLTTNYSPAGETEGTVRTT